MDAIYRQCMVYGWGGVWLDGGWLGCFGLYGLDEIRYFILTEDINSCSPSRHTIYNYGTSHTSAAATCNHSEQGYNTDADFVVRFPVGS